MPTPFEENGLQAPPQRGATLQIISRLCSLAAVFLAAFLVVYYGNALLLRLHGHLLDRQGNVTTLSFALSRVLIHGLQNMLIVVAWQAVARRLSHRTAHFADAVNIVVPPVAFMATAWFLPHLSPNLTLSFSMSPVLALLLLCLFHALTLRVENVLDRSLALILWLFASHSLEMITGAPFPQSALPEADAAFVSMTGFTLFFCFLAGAMSSSWLLVKYSIRLSVLKNSWIGAELKRGETSVSGINMLDVNNLVHDMKNVIAVIKGTARMMDKKEPSERTALLLKAADYMGTMTQELLSGDEKHDLALSELFRTIERHSSAFPWKDEVSMHAAPEVEGAHIMANKLRLIRAIFNILDNAWRGNALVGAHGILLQVRLDIHGRMAEFEIIDNGPGYSGTQAAGQSGWGSTGLGLAFTRRVISLHGGSLAITSRKDQKRGARVVIYLPILQGPRPSTPDA
mgnify:FL=1